MAERLIDREQAEKDLLHCAASVAETIDGTGGFAEAMAAIAPEFAKRDDFDLGVRLADTIDDPFARDQVLADIAVICAAAGDVDYAVELLDSLDEQSFQTLAKANIAVAEAERGNAERALEFAHQLDDPSGALAEIAIRLAAQGRFAEAVEAAEGAEFEGSRAWAFTEIGSRHLEREEKEEGLAMLERALEEADELELPEERNSLWLDVTVPLKTVDETERIGEILDEAEKEVTDIASEVARDRALTRIVEMNASIGRFDKATELTETIEDPLQAVAAMVATVPHLREAGENEKALKLLDEALQLTNDTDVWEERSLTTKETLLAALSIRYFEADRLEKAREVVLSIQTENHQARTLYTLAVRAVEKGEVDAARKLMALIKEDYSRAVYWTELVEKFSEEQSEAKADAMERARQDAPKAEILYQRVDAMLRVAARSDPAEGRAWYTKALETAAEIPGSTQQSLALLSLAQSYSAAELALMAAELELLRQLLTHAG
jgi:tetratricopeptide (TPR) repeat protein